MKKFITIPQILIMLFLTACAILPTVNPKTLDQKIAVTEATVIALTDTIAQSVEGGALSKEQGGFALSVARDARSAINNAWSFYRIQKEPEAKISLEIASQLLLELNKYLQEKR